MKKERETLKRQIRFSHTYRHLRVEKLKQNLYLWFVILPLFIVLLLNYDKLSLFISEFVRNILSTVIPLSDMTIVSSSFIPYLGDIHYISLPTAIYQSGLNLITLLISVLLFIFVSTGRRKGHPFSIFIEMGLFVQIISCIFFLFASNDFPYTATIYSELYIKQQISLWLFFFVIIGLVTVLLGSGYFVYNLVFVIKIISYSFIYGVLRYITYLFIVSQISTIYMATLFFTLGPLFDFLYITYFYGRYVSRIIEVNESKESEDIWQW